MSKRMRTIAENSTPAELEAHMRLRADFKETIQRYVDAGMTQARVVQVLANVFAEEIITGYGDDAVVITKNACRHLPDFVAQKLDALGLSA